VFVSNRAWLVALPENIRLGWRQLAVTNTLAYCNTKLITTVKGFIVQVITNFTPINFKRINNLYLFDDRVCFINRLLLQLCKTIFGIIHGYESIN
jgi:hypothetical protein